MKPREQNELISELFADGGLDALRESSLGDGLAVLRTRERRRHAWQAGATAAAALAVTVGVLWQSGTDFSAQPKMAALPASPHTVVSGVQHISDQELLALFPNRAVGLIGSPGRQQLVFFDETAPRS